jgi:hypothetical protein
MKEIMNSRFFSVVRVVLSVWWSALVITCFVPAQTVCAAQYGMPTDKNLQYIGRWDKPNPTEFIGYWNSPYIRCGFTGTSISIKLSLATKLVVSVDDAPYEQLSADAGITSLVQAPLAPGKHTLFVAADRGSDFFFAGFGLDEGARTYPLPKLPIIEFIGDSITSGSINNYAWLLCDAVPCDHVQVSHAAAALTTGYSFVLPNKTGMDSQYFLLNGFKNLEPSSQQLWHFSYKPKVIVIMLGQMEPSELPGEYASSYLTFVKRIRTKLNAPIFMLIPLSGNEADGVRLAYTTIQANHVHGVHLIDTTGWLGFEDLRDGVLPNARGSLRLATLLQPYLMPYL